VQGRLPLLGRAAVARCRCVVNAKWIMPLPLVIVAAVLASVC
jgi:hypothetical protein